MRTLKIEIKHLTANIRPILFKKIKRITIRIISCLITAIAEVHKNEGNDEYNKGSFSTAIDYYTDGIKVNCKDKELNAKLHSNRAAAHLYLGKY